MKVIVVGCGRVGAELAGSVAEKGFEVSVIDRDQHAFQRLNSRFAGDTIQGDVMDLAVLHRAGIETAYGFAAATPSDETNLVAGRIARDLFHVPNVVARVYNPAHSPIFTKAGIQTVVSSSWSANRIIQILSHPGILEVDSSGHGEIRFVEIKVPPHLTGKPASYLVDEEACQPFALTRGGTAVLAPPETILEEGDLVVIAIEQSYLPKLQAKLEAEET